MFRKLLLPIMAITLMIWVVGCSDNPATTDITQTTNLDDEFGGYTSKSETPAFGDTELLADDEAEEEVTDLMLSSPEALEVIEDPEAGFFHFRAVWGRMCYDSTVTELTDWTGSLSITRGAEVIRRVIRFEPGQDYIVERTQRELIEWVSATTVHHDGIAVDLFVPPVQPVFDTTITQVTDSLGNVTDVIVVDTTYPDVEPVTVTFETGPYTRTFSLGELAALDTVVELEDGNSVAFHAVQGFRVPCPRGFLYGMWGYDSTGAGVFKGRFMSQHGMIAGHVNGIWGETEDGEKVFRGKWINRSGEFEGYLSGTYGPIGLGDQTGNVHRRGGGWFRGLIYDANEMPIGALHGRYRSADMYRGGFFQARWKLYCNEIATDTDVDVLQDGF